MEKLTERDDMNTEPEYGNVDPEGAQTFCICTMFSPITHLIGEQQQPVQNFLTKDKERVQFYPAVII